MMTQFVFVCRHLELLVLCLIHDVVCALALMAASSFAQLSSASLRQHEGKPKIIYTPRLAGNAPFAHVGAPRGCQSVVLSVHMAKTRHSERMSGRKTARKRPNRDRIWISATRT
jgi:hypothetical protein